MPHRFGSFARVLPAALAAAGLSVVIGCHGAPAAPETASGVYSGPAIRLEPERGHYVAVVQSPSPGWQARVDRVEERFGYERVFVSLREPDPRATYAQVVVEQRLITPVLSGTRLEVWARTLTYDAPLDDEAPYRLAPATGP